MKISTSKLIGNSLRSLFFIMSLFGLIDQVSANGDEAAVVYFFPFEIDTYIPITTGTIKSTATQKWAISDSIQISRLASIVDHGVQAKFEDVNVRAAVMIGDRWYFLNRDGVVRDGDRSHKIDMDAFWKFRASLDERQIHSAL